MARKFAVAIDLQQLELLRAKVHNAAGDPNGVVGQIYWNTTVGELRVCTVAGSPGTWVGLHSGTITSAQIANDTIVDADIKSDAGILLSKLAVDPLARANHTGTQLAATISNFDTQVRTSRLDQMAAPTAAVPLGGQKITGLADPTSAQDAATKAYADSIAAGLDPHASVRAASTANVAALTGAVTLDTIVMATGDRALLKDQSTKSQNGIWVINTAGAWTRATDADTAGELSGGSFVFVEEGGTQADTGWVVTTNGSITPGTTAHDWSQFTGAGSTLGGSGLTQTGQVLDVNVDSSSIEVNADVLRVKAAGITNAMLAGSIDLTTKVTGQLPIANGGTAGTTAATARANLAAAGKYDNGAIHAAGATITITAATHGLGAGRGKLVQVIEESTGDQVETDVNIASNGDVVVTFASSQTLNTMRVVIFG